MNFGVVRIAAIVGGMLLAQAAQAELVKLSFEAEVTTFVQNRADPVGTFLGKPISIGDRITGYAQYETNLLNQSYLDGYGTYFDDSIGSGLTIDFKGASITTPACRIVPGLECTDRQLNTSYSTGLSFPESNDTFALSVYLPKTSAGRSLYSADLSFQLNHVRGDGSLPTSLSMSDILRGSLSLDTIGYSGGDGVIAKITKLQTLSPVPEPEVSLMAMAGLAVIWAARRSRRSLR